MNKFTLSDFLKRYPADEACLDDIFKLRFPKGVDCPTCKKIQKFYKVNNRTSYACTLCGYQVYPLAGTIFEKTTTSLRLWFYAMYLMVQTRAGISAKQLQRELGVTYKTAWRMFKQIRLLMADASDSPLSGIVEVDETFVGGKSVNTKDWVQGNKQKEIVMGMVQREGKAYLKHVPNTGKWTLLGQIQKQVKPGTKVMSDEWPSYSSLSKLGYDHLVVNHSAGEYVKGNVYTQNIECVWSTFKRGITGVYRHVGKQYLQSYADEYAFRYNNRKTPGSMFDLLLSQVAEVKAVSVLPVLAEPEIQTGVQNYFEEVF